MIKVKRYCFTVYTVLHSIHIHPKSTFIDNIQLFAFPIETLAFLTGAMRDVAQKPELQLVGHVIARQPHVCFPAGGAGPASPHKPLRDTVFVEDVLAVQLSDLYIAHLDRFNADRASGQVGSSR